MQKASARRVVRIVSVLALLGGLTMTTQQASDAQEAGVRAGATLPFITAIDTMKESMDTLNNRLTPVQIANDVQVASSLHANYVTVDTPYDYPDYAQQWVDAIRAAGKHVWFRMSWNAWLGMYDVPGTMTPGGFEAATRAFIMAHPAMFRAGDVFDICPEPEQGKYWALTYGVSWDWSPMIPNAATTAYNAFVRDGTVLAQNTFQQIGVKGVITTIRSMTPFVIEHDLEPATVSLLGQVTGDSFPEGVTIEPVAATNARISELQAMEAAWPVPVVLGEMGYSTAALVNDIQQEAVLRAEFTALRAIPYLAGVNYWVGAGYQTPDQYNGTRLFSGTTGAWSPRPAATDLATFFSAESPISPSPTTPPASTGVATSTASPAMSPVTSSQTATPSPCGKHATCRIFAAALQS